MEPEGSSPHSQAPATCPYPEPAQSSPHTPIPLLEEIIIIIIKGSGKEVEIQEFMYRDTPNVEPEMYDYANSNWSHWNSNEKLKEKFGSCTRKTPDRFTTKDSYGTSHIIRKVLQCEV
jgi:hypothetical protein